MNCLECQELLQRRLDGEAVATEALRSHLAACSACRERFAAADLMHDALKSKPRLSLKAGFAQQMAARVVRDRLQRRNRFRRRLLVTAALAASVLVLFLFSYWSAPRPDPVIPAPIAKQGEVKIPAPEIPTPEPRQDDARQALASYSERIVGKTREHARVLLTAANPLEQLPSGSLPSLDPAAESLIHASKDVTESVQTVTHSAQRAFAFFAREIPMWDRAKGN